MSTSRPKRTLTRPVGTAKSRPEPARGRVPWRAVGAVGGWVLTLAATAFGLTQLEPRARAIADAQPLQLMWERPPTWLTHSSWRDVMGELERSLVPVLRAELHDPGLCEDVAAQLSLSPWVSKVERVSKQSDGTLLLHVLFRKPFAMIEKNAISYLVDEHAVRLPRTLPASDVLPTDWLIVRGVKAPPPAEGQTWNGADLADGLKLASFLYRAEAAGQMPFRAAIAAIDVANADRKLDPRGGVLRLIPTGAQTYIHWGMPPGEEYNIECSAEQKLAALSKLYQPSGRFPDRAFIDVRPGDRILLGDPR